MSYLNPEPSNTRIGIIGGGIGGATIALKLAELGVNITLFEKEPHLVSGPPICHLHAGGNLYREISDTQCIELLKQSINTAKLYKHAIDYRPTVFAVPTKDDGEPSHIINRLKILQQEYQRLVDLDPANQVLGPAADYYTLFEREQVEKLALLNTPESPETPEQWLIEFAKSVDLTQLKFPLMLVQEYGVSVFRVGAAAALALEQSPHCQILTQTCVKSVVSSDKGWRVEIQQHTQQQELTQQQSSSETIEVDYLINACGFRTGSIDDMIGVNAERMVEFKAAYVCHWQNSHNNWPEVVFHGERGTANGMTQLTPYPGGYFQIHGMTPDITLFKDGLVSSKPDSAQPKLAHKFLSKVDHKWDLNTVKIRTIRAIDKVVEFIPSFNTAQLACAPLYGAQQIPGVDSTLRVADVAFEYKRYARCEIVKASSALSAAHSIIENLVQESLISETKLTVDACPITDSLTEHDVTVRAEQLTLARKYPTALANRNYPSATRDY